MTLRDWIDEVRKGYAGQLSDVAVVARSWLTSLESALDSGAITEIGERPPKPPRGCPHCGARPTALRPEESGLDGAYGIKHMPGCFREGSDTIITQNFIPAWDKRVP